MNCRLNAPELAAMPRRMLPHWRRPALKSQKGALCEPTGDRHSQSNAAVTTIIATEEPTECAEPSKEIPEESLFLHRQCKASAASIRSRTGWRSEAGAVPNAGDNDGDDYRGV